MGALLTLGDTAAEATLETTATFDKLHIRAHIGLTAITADGTTFSMIHKIWRCLPIKRNDMPLPTNPPAIISNGIDKMQEYTLIEVAFYLIWRQRGQGFNDSSQGNLGLFGHVGIAGHVVGCTTDVAWTCIPFGEINIMHILVRTITSWNKAYRFTYNKKIACTIHTARQFSIPNNV